MKLGYDLTIEQTQKLSMTPELIQAIQILQFNIQELDQYVQEQLLTNPCLEVASSADEAHREGTADENSQIVSDFEGSKSMDERKNPAQADKDFDWQQHIREREYDDISYKQYDYNKDREDYSFEQFAVTDITLSENLMFQLQFADAGKSCIEVAKFIIQALDDNGYLTQSIEEIAETLNIPAEKAEKALKIVQGMEPWGVGARNLSECLLIQLTAMGVVCSCAERIVTEFLEELADNKLGVISKELGISINKVQELADIIKKLEPKPGRQFAGGGATRYIIPDVIVEKDSSSDEYIVSVNEDSAPRLMISSYYEKLLTEAEHDQALSKYLSGRVNAAIWLIKSIEQRKQTIYNVASAVVKYQRDFFEMGDMFLKTLTLKQIAEEVGIHESTVSRSINGKYVQSPRGVFEMKYFFTSGVSGEKGEGISSNSIKYMIKEIVSGEDPKAPYSDQDMVKMLMEKGIEISRRTVAKYRDEMNILSSSKRKRY